MDKDYGTNETAGDNQIEEENSDTNKDIKREWMSLKRK
jgi:hypothetical protein